MPEPRDLLANCLEEVESGRRDIASALAACGEFVAELTPLVEIALRFRQLERPVPSATFRRGSLARLVARIGASGDRVNGHRDTGSRSAWRRRGSRERPRDAAQYARRLRHL